MENKEVTVFTKNNCTQCDATKAMLDNLDVDYNLINIEEQPEFLNQLKSIGARSAPVVMVPGDWWAGHKEDKILEHFGK